MNNKKYLTNCKSKLCIFKIKREREKKKSIISNLCINFNLLNFKRIKKKGKQNILMIIHLTHTHTLILEILVKKLSILNIL